MRRLQLSEGGNYKKRIVNRRIIRYKRKRKIDGNIETKKNKGTSRN